jgi:predicted RNA-binding protein with EMAP domain
MGMNVWKVKYTNVGGITYDAFEILEGYLNDNDKLYFSEKKDKKKILDELKDLVRNYKYLYKDEEDIKQKEYYKQKIESLKELIDIIKDLELEVDYEFN